MLRATLQRAEQEWKAEREGLLALADEMAATANRLNETAVSARREIEAAQLQESRAERILMTESGARALDRAAASMTALSETTTYFRRRSEEVRRRAHRLEEDRREAGARLERTIAGWIDSKLDDVLPPFRALDRFQTLLGEPARLRDLCKGIFESHEVDSLMLPAAAAHDPRLLPAVHMLHVSANGPTTGIQHYVVDEAQDVSPLQYRLLRLNGRSAHLTAVGDLAQRLHDFGIASWQQAAEAFESPEPEFRAVSIAYRNTRQISEFANSVLKHVAPELPPSTPFPREGEAVRVDSFRTPEEEMTFVADAIRSSPFGSIGVLVPDADALAPTAGSLRRAGIECASGLGAGVEDPSVRVTLLTAAEARGVEYELVFVIGADELAYRTPAQGRALYVAATRALHQLFVTYVGVPSPFLGSRGDDGRGPQPGERAAETQTTVPLPAVRRPRVLGSGTRARVVGPEATPSGHPVELDRASTIRWGLEQLGLDYIDRSDVGKRPIWVPGDESLAEKLAQMEALGCSFRFASRGGIATDNKPAWWIQT